MKWWTSVCAVGEKHAFMTDYCQKRSCEGYVFTGMCLSTGVAWSGGVLGVPDQGGVCSRGGFGGCLVPGGGWVCSWRVSGPGGLLQGGAWWRPPGGMATAADSTHPTGMHSRMKIVL